MLPHIEFFLRISWTQAEPERQNTDFLLVLLMVAAVHTQKISDPTPPLPPPSVNPGW